MKRHLSTLILLASVTAMGALGCSKQAPAAPGSDVVAPRASSGTTIGDLGIEMRLPKGTTLEPGADDSVRVRVPQLPTLVVAREPNPTGAVTTAAVGARGKVKVTRTTVEHRWTCSADEVSDAVLDRVKAICGTMRPPDRPRITTVRCRNGGGQVDEGRESWMREHSAAYVSCYRAEVQASRAVDRAYFVVTAKVEGDGPLQTSHRYSARATKTADPDCFERAAEALRSEAGFAPAGDGASFKCTVNFGRY